MKQLIIFLIYFLLIGLVLSACSSATTPSPVLTASPTQFVHKLDLNVFAAASLAKAFEELANKFEADHINVNIVHNFAGSQQLAQQIAVGAPVDVFASANQAQMNAAITSGRIQSIDSQVFAENRLVVIYPVDNPAGLEKLEDLASTGLRIVQASREVPVGQYSDAFLDHADQVLLGTRTYKMDVLGNVVSYENNVKAVLAKVVLGEADAGIVYTSDISNQTANMVGLIEIPDELNVTASYSIAPIIDSAHPDLARAYIDFVISPSGQAILGKFGFLQISP